MKTFRIESKDFKTCWLALSHSERIFKEAILRKDYPNDSSENEFLGYLADIQETKGKIEELFKVENPIPEVHWCVSIMLGVPVILLLILERERCVWIVKIGFVKLAGKTVLVVIVTIQPAKQIGFHIGKMFADV